MNDETKKETEKPPVKFRKRVVIDIMPDGSIATNFRQAPSEGIPTRLEVNRMSKALDVGYAKLFKQYRLDLAMKQQTAGVSNAS